jgi:hypothetical protein
MEISHENVRQNCGSTRSDFHEFIGGFIISTCNVVELKAVKLVLKAPYFLAVGMKMKPDYIAHVDSKGRDEEQARACSCFHQ